MDLLMPMQKNFQIFSRLNSMGDHRHNHSVRHGLKADANALQIVYLQTGQKKNNSKMWIELVLRSRQNIKLCSNRLLGARINVTGQCQILDSNMVIKGLTSLVNMHIFHLLTYHNSMCTVCKEFLYTHMYVVKSGD